MAWQAVGNGDPTDIHSFTHAHALSFRGELMAIVQAAAAGNGTAGGEVTLTASCRGRPDINPAEVRITRTAPHQPVMG